MTEISAYRDGVKFEHERIIKLLESHRLPNCNGDTDESGYCLTCNINLHDAVALIKGEDWWVPKLN